MNPQQKLQPGHYRAYLDCEFTTLDSFYELISLALVIPQGSEFYVEITDTWSVVDCTDFVQRVVLPQLDADQYGKTLADAGIALQAWLSRFESLEIVNDAPHYDWPLLLRLAGPKGLPAHVSARSIPHAERELLTAIDFPHHALLDARLIAAFIEPRIVDGTLSRD